MKGFESGEFFQDFKKTVFQHGFKIEDFEISEGESLGKANFEANNFNGDKFESGSKQKTAATKDSKITVKRKGTDKKRSYDLRQGANWVFEFGKDLKNGFFN